jgi:hypothetical protein
MTDNICANILNRCRGSPGVESMIVPDVTWNRFQRLINSDIDVRLNSDLTYGDGI